MFQLIFRYGDQWNNKFNHRVTDSGIEVSIEYSAIKFKIKSLPFCKIKRKNMNSQMGRWTKLLKKCIMQSNLVNLGKCSW